MALLHYFFFNRGRLGLREVLACHLNHNLRGEESDSDEKLVREFCGNNGIGLTVSRLGTEELEAGAVSEDRLRKLRYDFFEQTGDSTCSDYIATAHTLNDNAETVLFRLARGTGFRGASGIPATRGRFIRPLLSCSRQEIEEYCEENGVPFCIDSSNESDGYSRNVIRHHVIPVLKDLNAHALEALENFASLSGEADSYFVSEAERIIESDGIKDGFRRSSVLGAKAPLDRYIVRELIGRYCPEPDRQTVDRCMDALRRGGRTELTTGIYLNCSADSCKVEREYTPRSIGPVAFDSFDGGGRSVGFELRVLDPERDSLKDLFPYCVDYDKLTGVAYVRNRRDGDRFPSYYRGCTKSLKKIFSEKHYSAEKKDSILILTDDTGIVWVEGEGPAQGKQIGPETKTVLRFNTL